MPTTAAGAAGPSAPPPVPHGGGHAQAGVVSGAARPGAQTTVTTPPGLRGVDIASYQHPSGAAINWRSVAASGVQFAYVKATEGIGYVNPYYASDQLGAKAAGLYVGAYAFARPDTDNPAAQADYLLRNAPYNSDGRTLPPMIDLEGPYSGITGENLCWNLSPAAMLTWINTFVSTVRERTGVRPLIYVNKNWWGQCTGGSAAFAAYPLDVASWTSTPNLPFGWSNYTVWQYTDAASVPGIQGNVDGDVFRGSRTALNAWAAPDRNIRVSADVTGDGSADLVADYGSSTDVMTSTGSGFAIPAVWANTPFSGSVATLAADVNGDGKADLVAVNSSRDHSANSTWVMTSNGSAFGAPQQWSIAPFYGSIATFAADVNGDRAADLVAVNANSVWVMTSTGTGFSAPRQWHAGNFYGNVTTVPADFTGDGKADLVAINRTNAWVMTSNGTGFDAPRQWHAGAFYGNVTTMPADFTGDGKADLVAINRANAWVMTSTGSTFSAPQVWSPTAFYGTRTTLAADVNGDRSADLIAVNAANTYVETSTGSAFATPVPWSSAFF